MESHTGPRLDDIYRLFSEQDSIPDHHTVDEREIPEPYRRLLVHPHHMTVTVEEYYRSPVNVQVLARAQAGNYYSRQIVLALNSTGQIVQFGIVRINLDQCSQRVRDAILAEKTPLGRILIENDVMRRIEPTSYLRIRTDAILMQTFGLSMPCDVWGRLAIIHCDGQPAIELLEVLAPIDDAHSSAR